jgi:hypothetical protein
MRRIRTRIALLLGLTGAFALSVATSAGALTLGSLAPPDSGGCSSCDAFQLRSGAGAPKYRVPAGPTGAWTLTSWSSQGGGTMNGRARLRVYRPTGSGGQFELVKQTLARTIAADAHPVIQANLKVQKGDLLGLGTGEAPGVPAGYPTAFPNSLVRGLLCDPTGPGQIAGPGSNCPLVSIADNLVNVEVELTPR